MSQATMKKLNQAQTGFLEALLSLDRLSARKTALDQGLSGDPLQPVNGLIVPALECLGEMWEKGEASLSQVYMSSRICEELTDELLPPRSPQRIDQPKMAIAVLNDYHLLGKRIVYAMLRASGYDLLDYHRQTVESLAERVRLDAIQILLVSTLMLPSALDVRKLKNLLMEKGLVAVRLLAGGAPFRLDPALAGEVGADGTGVDAAEAVRLVATLIDGRGEA